MTSVPPIVRSTVAGGTAYLIAWERSDDGAWGAHIAWVVLEGEAWKVRSAHVAADDLQQVEGQQYQAVPRRSP
ncbi:hypothetical protein [Actinomadura fibrosa]|uniref:Uncharacterized protein n=1 Tax=Actinomadura fibrosa TaxID=111802 RepID=A0ABW2XZI9_9ACTN|nr:hypothetical protein [Actinomadura fibrosa]